jgi:hypothetical protein
VGTGILAAISSGRTGPLRSLGTSAASLPGKVAGRSAPGSGRWVFGSEGALGSAATSEQPRAVLDPDRLQGAAWYGMQEGEAGTPSTTTLSMLKSMRRRETTCLVGVYGSGFWVW